jgi:DNA-binding NtrC family response regulator
MNAITQSSVILLVDDDHNVRRLCRIVLDRAGFRVIEADSPDAAQAAWNIHGQGIDMLVTDFDMPGMTGLQLSASFRAAKPELKILLVSGNSGVAVPSSIAFLPKPFCPSDLTEAVCQCLLS